jgi:oxygen-independent coproporphyrinogen-3 oxidase
MAAKAGFENIGADLIFGLPGQLAGEWHSCLNIMAGLGLKHISAYGLQIEEGTPLAGKIGAGELSPCDEDEEAEMFTGTMKALQAKGYKHYEISNYALPGSECRHNLLYWRNKTYLGLGPAAHSYFKGARFANAASLENYESMVITGGFPVLSAPANVPEMEMAETVFLGLRLIEGLYLKDFQVRFGRDIESVYSEEIQQLLRDGLLKYSRGFLRLTERGIAMGNRVFSAFV